MPRRTECKKDADFGIVLGNRLVLEIPNPKIDCDVTVTDLHSPGSRVGYGVLGTYCVECNQKMKVKFRERNLGRPAPTKIFVKPAGTGADDAPDGAWREQSGSEDVGPGAALDVCLAMIPR